MLYPVILAFRFFLTGSGSATAGSFDLNFGEFSYSYTVLMIFSLLMALGTMKDLSLFVKLNTYGSVLTVVVIIFILSVGSLAMLNPNVDIGGVSIPPLKLFDFTKYKSLLGILSGGYFCHNLSVPMLRSAANP
jgi:hypothetical protein